MHTYPLPAKAGNDGYSEPLASIKNEKNNHHINRNLEYFMYRYK